MHSPILGGQQSGARTFGLWMKEGRTSEQGGPWEAARATVAEADTALQVPLPNQ